MKQIIFLTLLLIASFSMFSQTTVPEKGSGLFYGGSYPVFVPDENYGSEWFWNHVDRELWIWNRSTDTWDKYEQGNATDEIQTLSTEVVGGLFRINLSDQSGYAEIGAADNSLTTFVTGDRVQFGVSPNASIFDDWDKDATDDFSGSALDLADVPSNWRYFFDYNEAEDPMDSLEYNYICHRNNQGYLIIQTNIASAGNAKTGLILAEDAAGASKVVNEHVGIEYANRGLNIFYNNQLENTGNKQILMRFDKGTESLIVPSLNISDIDLNTGSSRAVFMNAGNDLVERDLSSIDLSEFHDDLGASNNYFTEVSGDVQNIDVTQSNAFKYIDGEGLSIGHNSRGDSVYQFNTSGVYAQDLVLKEKITGEVLQKWRADGRVTFFDDINVNGNKVFHEDNDGTGSGLDADSLDGNDSSYLLDYANHTNTPFDVITGGYRSTADFNFSGGGSTSYRVHISNNAAGNALHVQPSYGTEAIKLSEGTTGKDYLVIDATNDKMTLGDTNTDVDLSNANTIEGVYHSITLHHTTDGSTVGTGTGEMVWLCPSEFSGYKIVRAYYRTGTNVSGSGLNVDIEREAISGTTSNILGGTIAVGTKAASGTGTATTTIGEIYRANVVSGGTATDLYVTLVLEKS